MVIVFFFPSLGKGLEVPGLLLPDIRGLLRRTSDKVQGTSALGSPGGFQKLQGSPTSFRENQNMQQNEVHHFAPPFAPNFPVEEIL